MKRILSILLSIILIVALCMLISCKDADTESSADNDVEDTTNNDSSNIKEEKMDQFVLKGIVKGFNTHLEIEVIESDYAFGIYWVIVPKDTPVLDKNGDNIELSSLSEGDIVVVTYNGQTMMSYPPQIVALKIEKSDT